MAPPSFAVWPTWDAACQHRWPVCNSRQGTAERYHADICAWWHQAYTLLDAYSSTAKTHASDNKILAALCSLPDLSRGVRPRIESARTWISARTQDDELTMRWANKWRHAAAARQLLQGRIDCSSISSCTSMTVSVSVHRTGRPSHSIISKSVLISWSHFVSRYRVSLSLEQRKLILWINNNSSSEWYCIADVV